MLWVLKHPQRITFNIYIYICVCVCVCVCVYTLAKVAQLVRVNTEKCGPNKWHMVLGSNPSTNDTLNLLSIGCCGVVGTLRFGSPWRVLRAYPWKAPWLSKKKKSVFVYTVHICVCVYMHLFFKTISYCFTIFPFFFSFFFFVIWTSFMNHVLQCHVSHWISRQPSLSCGLSSIGKLK